MVASKPLVAREYLRVSRDSDGSGKSVTQQHDENASAIAAQGWDAHPGPYKDDDRSASRYARREREGFKQLIDDLEADSFDAGVLVLWESSRGSRRVGEWVDLIDLCQLRGVRIWVTTHNRLYDPDNSRDRRTLLEDAVDAAYESDKTRERIKRDAAAAAKAGRVHGKNIYGYRRHYRHTPTGAKIDRIEPDPEQAPVVTEAARRVLDGESYYAIAKDYNARGIPPRRPSHAKDGRRKHFGWTGGAIKQMLSMPAYAGKRAHNGEIVADAVWPALIEYEQWQKIQSLLFRPGRRRNPNQWTVRYMCTGVVVCAICGARLRVGKQNKGAAPKLPDEDTVTKKEFRAAVAEREEYKRRRREECVCTEGPDDDGTQGADRCPWHYRTYTCSGLARPGGDPGFHVAMRVEHLDSIIDEMTIARLEQPDFLTLVNQRSDGTDDERRALLDEIAGHQRYLETVKERAAETHDLNLLFDQQERIQPLIDAAQRRVEALAQVDPAVIELASSGEVRTRWGRLDVVDKRRIISALAVPHLGRAARRGERGLHPERVEPGWR
ncbi:MAG: recombinase family protein [Gordonia sp. (in: high G+C Gram-positive bacteria)]|uniref:recombinase family protein n=1 Tax=Gordonia sp. (in: high G+C Gram-positive bacteria) TaxID=84139 RepID=UPI0039E30227